MTIPVTGAPVCCSTSVSLKRLSAGVAVPRVLGHVPVDAVASQVQQLVGAGEQRADDLLGRWPYVLGGDEAALQRAPHGFRFGLRALELEEAADGSPITSAVFSVTEWIVRRNSSDSSCRSNPCSMTQGFRPSRRAVFEQLPRVARRLLVEQQHDVVLIGRALLQLVRQQQIEQRPGHRAVVARAGDRLLDVLVDELALGREQAHLRARAACQGGEAQPAVGHFAFARAAQDLEPLPPIRRLVVGEAAQTAIPPSSVGARSNRLANAGLLRQHVQRFERLHRAVFPQLDELERADRDRSASSPSAWRWRAPRRG